MGAGDERDDDGEENGRVGNSNLDRRYLEANEHCLRGLYPFIAFDHFQAHQFPCLNHVSGSDYTVPIYIDIRFHYATFFVHLFPIYWKARSNCI